MGWTSYYATEYKKGQIDRLAECRKEFGNDSNWGTILKDRMVGSTYYAAVQLTKTKEIFGLVVLTSVNGREFAYKDMSDTCGPYAYDCPNSILKLLSPTDNEYALEWRKQCQKRNEKRKLLNNASLIKFIVQGEGWSHYKDGDICTVFKRKWGKAIHWIDSSKPIRWSTSQILSQDFEVIK